jgi:hypothetical protein
MKKPSIAFLVSFVLPALMLFPAAASALDVGEKAPLFSGSSTRGKIQLADYRGEKNVVLALYFAVFTPV